MLEVLNLTKVYKTKGGADVNAPDGVSLRFPERGMVFLLGKSGGGESTLLTDFVATFLPVCHAARKKPVESICAL